MLDIGVLVKKQIVAEAKQREEEHVSSGGLSASMLGNPLQWQVLKYLGVKQKEHDDYTYCKFQRGRDVEDFIFDKLVASGINASSQKKAKYRNCVGLIDIYLPETNEVYEIKSTTNAAFRFIKKSGAKRNHILQACLYALSVGADTFSVVYVASDDYRCEQFKFNTKDWGSRVDEIIDAFETAIKSKVIPTFVAKEKWQEQAKYSMYPEWSNVNSSYLSKKAKELYK